MNELQKKFCVEFVIRGNATEAYKAAGYKVRSDNAARVNASRLLTNANVQEAIAALRAKMESEKIMDAKERRETLTAIARSRAEDSQDRIRAIDTMNKMDGLYINKTQLSGADGGPLTIAWESADDGK